MQIILKGLMKIPKNIGLYFGTFNPIHIGHLIIAEQILSLSQLEEIWFVVSPQNPFKNKKSLLKANHRLAMVKIAIDDNPFFKACDIEFSLPQPSYTVHTLVYLQEKYPEKTFSLILGSDNLVTFDKWFNYEYILENYNIYVYPRPSSQESPFDKHKSIKKINAPLIEISSSYIRNAIKNNISINYMLHPKVMKYIDEMNFYRK